MHINTLFHNSNHKFWFVSAYFSIFYSQLYIVRFSAFIKKYICLEKFFQINYIISINYYKYYVCALTELHAITIFLLLYLKSPLNWYKIFDIFSIWRSVSNFIETLTPVICFWTKAQTTFKSVSCSVLKIFSWFFF